MIEANKTALRLVLPSLLAGLLAGAWVGARCERAEWRRARREGPSVDKIMRRLERDLSLRAEQRAPVRAALEARRPAFDAARRDGEERLRTLRADTDKALEPLLDEAQRKRLTELRERREARRRENAKP